jgi:hypothetical protein
VEGDSLELRVGSAVRGIFCVASDINEILLYPVRRVCLSVDEVFVLLEEEDEANTLPPNIAVEEPGPEPMRNVSAKPME